MRKPSGIVGWSQASNASSNAADAAETGRRILEAATTLFAERGFTGVSLAEVASAAGVTRGAVYHHFNDRIGLLRAVASRLQHGVASAVTQAADAAGSDVSAQLRAGSHAFLDAITVAPAARILLVDAPGALGWAEWRRLDAENSVTLLRDALVALGVPGERLDATAALLSGAMNEAALWLSERPRDEPARRAVHDSLDALLDAFC